MQLSRCQAVSCCAPASTLSDAWLSRWGLWVALLGQSSWWWPGVFAHVPVCVSPEEAPGCRSLTPSMKMTPFGSTVLYSSQKFLFSLHRALSHLILPTTQRSRQDKLSYTHFMDKDNFIRRGWLAQDAISGRAVLIPVHDFATISTCFLLLI